MPSHLVIIDTRFRVAGSQSDFVIDIPGSLVDVKRISLEYADIPHPPGTLPPAIIVDIEGLAGVSYTGGGSGSGALAQFGSFVLPTTASPSTHSIFREKSDFSQALDLNPPQRYARLRVRILKSDGADSGMTKDSFLILRAE